MGPKAPKPFHTANDGTRNSAHVLMVGAVNVVRPTPITIATHAARVMCGVLAHCGAAVRPSAALRCTAAAVASSTTAAVLLL